MNSDFQIDSLCAGERNGVPFVAGALGFPVTHKDLQTISRICSEILASKTSEQIDFERNEYHKNKYPDHYYQTREHERPDHKKKHMADPRKQVPGYVYVFQSEATGLYKIGLSINPSKRLKEVSRKQKASIVSVATFYVQNMESVEFELHSIFDLKRVSGEWFELNADDVTKIKDTVKAIGGVA